MAVGDLPVRLSSFVGRESELVDLAELAGEHRLVTLTGPGGGGKTRLALTLADRLRPSYSGGVRWVGLAEIANAEVVVPAVADALGLPEATEEAVTATTQETGSRGEPGVREVVSTLREIDPLGGSSRGRRPAGGHRGSWYSRPGEGAAHPRGE